MADTFGGTSSATELPDAFIAARLAAVPRFAYRRLIALVVLVCQVATAGVVHVPVAYADAPAQTTTAPPCHVHSHSLPTNSSDAATGAASHTSAPSDDGAGNLGGHFGFCKSGLCHCTCAHPPAAPRA